MKRVLSIFKTLFIILFVLIITGCQKDEVATKDYYVVTFNSNGGTEIASIEVKPGETIKKPNDPEKDGYTFIEWQQNGRRFNFSTAINEDITLKAKWELTGTGDQSVTEYTVFFDSNGGTKVDNIKVKSGTKVNKPNDPTRNGHTFVEWQLNGKTYDFDNAVNNDMELIAKWKKNEEPKPTETPKPSPSPSSSPSPSVSPQPSTIPQPSTQPTQQPSTSPTPSRPPSLPDPDPIAQSNTVFFNTNGGTLIDAIVVKKGLTVTRPQNPTKDGYNFVEWQLSGATFDFNTPITENITLTAIWSQKSFTVGLSDIQDDTENKRLTVYENGVEKIVKEIQLMDGTKLCDGNNPIVPITSLTNVTQLKIILVSNIEVIANVQ